MLDALRSAPLTLAFSTLLGAAFAVGHHAFYNSLNNQQTPNSQYDILGIPYSISGQQIALSAGTLFAFITKYWLGYAVSTAFQQIAWRKLRQQSNTLGTIDNILDVLGNGFLCFSPALWKGFTNAMPMAVVFWLLPVMSFITPSTLTVHMKQISNASMQLVPRVDFTSMNFAFLAAGEASSPVYNYLGPQYGVRKAVTLALTDGEIQPISPPQANSSWVLKFNGPAINCQPVNATLHQEITDNIFDTINASYRNSTPCGISYGYISWVPDSSTSNGSLPFTNSSGSYSLRSGTVGPKGEDFAASDGYPYPASYPPLAIMVAALPRMYSGLSENCNMEKSALNDSTILECSLYNATYISNFTYVNGAQTINTTLPLKHISDVGYIGGVEGSYPFGVTYANGTIIDPQGSAASDYNTTLVEMFSYQAVMDAFGMMMVGTVANYQVDDGAWSLVAKDTSLMTTVFLQTNELAFLQSADQDRELSELGREQVEWLGDSITISGNGTMPLLDALEDAFRNATLSLIAQYSLQPNMSSPYAPGKVNVTVTSSMNVYLYSKGVLWTAYGLGIFFTLLCVVSGVLAFIANGERTYNTKFSTILRTTRDAPLVDRPKQQHEDEQIEIVQIHAEDLDGKSPLPPYLARAEILMAQNEYHRIQDGVEDIELGEPHHPVVSSITDGQSTRQT
ncbi:hypothetical protein UA08_05353 [Talaromyces atroroseus]|uniref:Uncharacterized protein n=1 Tax=Talaromyces atroroseus TaxID=1441469 RepID=A0A225AYP1_TALAT|nr:hypothetical protein UA08_05353 [Talaromyces atroroseus]OKL59585.1 hypothetical protein UA08_05353 [Talaromyces atroroseus]